MELETINKLYLELSQVATARTAKDLAFGKLTAEITELRQMALNLCWRIEKCGASEQQTGASLLAARIHHKLVDLDNANQKV